MTDPKEHIDKCIESGPDLPADIKDEYERAMQRAFARMEKGFHLGDIPKLDRYTLHDRNALRLPDPN